MILKSLSVEGYRSIRERVTLHIEPSVTVIVGANDHGKTNLLCALRHLNTDFPFDQDRDLSWDCAKQAQDFPRVECVFKLSEIERKLILDAENEARGFGSDGSRLDGDKVGDEDPPEWDVCKIASVPSEILISRTGVSGDLVWEDAGEFCDGADSLVLSTLIPQVAMIAPWSEIRDTVNAKQITTDDHEFMRGIFYYAGLDPDDDSLFIQNDQTERVLAEASKVLTLELRKSWSQGLELEFKLAHDSKNSTIELKIQDPNVKGQFVRPSRRSSGFTHYFAMKMILHSRQCEYGDREIIFVFDEPGIYLHPSGQQDLLQVLEKLGQEYQILYTTHSLFMLNKTYPTRHRLVLKSGGSTQVDGKPYSGRWGALTSALGLNLTGNVLFASRVLISEGDSDPIYLQAVLQKLVEMGKFNFDLNSFTVLSSEQSRNADALIRILQENEIGPKIALLFDGDEGGTLRLQSLQPIVKKLSLPVKTLGSGQEIEDNLIDVEGVFVYALASYAKKMIDLRSQSVAGGEDLAEKFADSFRKKFDKPQAVSGVSKWADEAFVEITGLPKPSKLGVAREYVQMLEQRDPASLEGGHRTTRASKLAEWIAEELLMPKIGYYTESVVQS